jgi:hypothetical protein
MILKTMSRIVPRVIVPIVLAGVALLSTRDVAALTAIELTLAQLVAASTLVVEGQPAEAFSIWEDTDGAHGHRIITYTRLDVLDVIDGQVPTEPVWVRTLGGQVGEIGQRTEGEALFVFGQPGVFFLRKRPDATHAVVGMSQGHYPIEPSAGRPVERRTARALHVDAMVPQLGHALGEPAAARVVLAGKTLPEVRALIATERASHAR